MTELVNTMIPSNRPETTKKNREFFRSIIGDVSFSVCLPKQYAIGLGLHKGDFVRVTQEESKIIIEKAD
jgi:hypothetical protein